MPASTTQVLIDLLGFAKQIRNVLAGRLEQSIHLSHLVLEFLGEFPLLLVSPSLFQLVHLGRECHRALLQFLGEDLQITREAAEMFGIDYGLIHGAFSGSGDETGAATEEEGGEEDDCGAVAAGDRSAVSVVGSASPGVPGSASHWRSDWR